MFRRGSERRLPTELEAHIGAFLGAQREGCELADALADFLRFLDRQPPEAVVVIAAKLKFELYYPAGRDWNRGERGAAVTGVVRQLFPDSPDFREMLREPDLERVYLFHSSGYLREAALNKLSGGLQSPFAVAAVMLRLNDWVPSVRQAARSAARRVLPLTDPAHVAAACLFLLRHVEGWQRWESGVTVFVEEMDRPEVLAALASLLRETMLGGVSASLRAVLRHEGFDQYLPMLAREAKLPQLRAVALRALVTGKASWPNGYAWVWTDKSLGQRRWQRVFAERAVHTSLPPESLIEAGSRDRSAAVRKAAADGLVTHRHTLRNVDEIVARLAEDRSRPVRDRVDFVMRDRARTA